MARKKSTSEPGLLIRVRDGLISRIQGLSFRSNPAFARKAVISTVAVCVLALLSWGLHKLDANVRRLAKYENTLALQWVGVPGWLRLEHNRHILETLTREINLRAGDRLLDPNLAQRLGSALLRPDIGWIKEVKQVLIRPDGIVSVHCEFREPKAWVLYKKRCFLIDGEGTRLPGKYEPKDCQGSTLMMLNGVTQPPPPVGEVWPGEDLSKGLSLVTTLCDHPFSHQIQQVIVSNMDGRIDKNKPEMELVTNRPNSRVLWGKAPNQENGTEISAQQKLALLDSLYKRWGRIDLNRSYVDVRTHPDSVVAPSSSRRLTDESIARR